VAEGWLLSWLAAEIDLSTIQVLYQSCNTKFLTSLIKYRIKVMKFPVVYCGENMMQAVFTKCH